MTLIVGDPNLFGERSIIGVAAGQVSVSAIEKEQADSIIRSGHYSRSVAWASSIHLGVYVDDDLIGAIQFGPAMNPKSGASIVAGTTPGGWLELNRMWLSDEKPSNTTSRAISCAMTYLKHVRPGVQWVQSFADERCGKLGAVYQACSFTYCGSHESTWYSIDGVWVHKSMLGRKEIDGRGWWCGPKIAWVRENEHRAEQHVFRQFRYIKFLYPQARRRLLLPVLPYPKPERLAMSTRDASETQSA